MGKFKSFLKRNKNKLTVAMTCAFMAIVSAVSCFAAEDDALKQSFQSSLSTVQTDVLGYIALAAPVGLAIFGVTLAIRKGVGFVRQIIGRG